MTRRFNKRFTRRRHSPPRGKQAAAAPGRINPIFIKRSRGHRNAQPGATESRCDAGNPGTGEGPSRN